MAEEYILKTGSLSDCQKWLNQWKHEYTIEIISVQYIGQEFFMAIKRTKKGE